VQTAECPAFSVSEASWLATKDAGVLADAPRRDDVFAGLPLLDGDGAHAVHSRPPLQNDCRGLTYRETTKAAIYRFPV